jgi:hypothetical protein
MPTWHIGLLRCDVHIGLHGWLAWVTSAMLVDVCSCSCCGFRPVQGLLRMDHDAVKSILSRPLSDIKVSGCARHASLLASEVCYMM